MRLRALALLVVAGLVLGGLAAQAQAATYTVGTTSDTAPGTACSTFPSGCSLRQLIEYVTNNPNPPDTIVVPANSYSLTSGALSTTQSMTIAGAGARTTIVFGYMDRVFDIQTPNSGAVPTVTISGLTITQGMVSNCTGAGGFGGDVRNSATLTLSEDSITAGAACSGGGVSNYGGTLTITHSLISGNRANSGGSDSGGIQNFGPNPVTGAAGSLTVDNSTIAKNTAALGGGIFSWNDASNTTTVVNSTIAYNDGGTRTDENNAGGLLSQEVRSSPPPLPGGGTISVENSIVAFNTVGTPAAGTASNCGPTGISSLGYNLETGTDCGFKSTGDLQSRDPQFTSNSPQNNGGNTGTFAPKSSSPVVDHIPLGAPGCFGSDQRDISRPQGPGCDTGAVELLQPPEGQQFSTVVASPGCAVSGTPTINWGDGTSSSGTPPAPGQAGAITGTHAYSEEGMYTVTTNWTDDCGTHTFSFTIQVPDANLGSTPAPVNAQARVPFSGPVATFTDADPAGTVSDYAATINWGDGSASPGSVVATGSGFTVYGTHTYQSGGSYPMAVSISDLGGASTTVFPTASVAPAVSGISPASGPLAGGNTVTISGSGFTGATAVRFGTTPATSFTVIGDSQITATAPPGTGTVDVTVTGPGGTSATSAADRYTYAPAPAVSGVSPSSGPSTGGNTVTISGSGFTGATAVRFGSTLATAFTVLSDTQITATAPPGTGTVDVTVTTPGGTSATSAADHYTYVPAPAVSGVSPSSGPPGGGTKVTISGSGFTGATAARFGAVAASSFTVVSDSQISATAPPGTGTVDVTVTGPGGTSATSAADRYLYSTAPALTTSAPQVLSSSGAAFVGMVNPQGLPTTAHFEYFLDSQYGAQPVLLTPDQQVGSDYSNHAVSASVTGLVPNARYHMRLVAKNSAGTTQGPDQTFTTAKDPPPPPPVIGKSFNFTPESGLVFIKLPGGPARDLGPRAASSTTGRGYIPLTEARQLPTGTRVDSRRGTMGLVAASTARHKTQTGHFGGAIFVVTQARNGVGLTTLKLLSGAFPGAPSRATCKHKAADLGPSAADLGPSAHAARYSQTLRSRGHGHFRSGGGTAAATVRGTVWDTTDSCAGTLVVVHRGTVIVFDFVRHKTVILHAGQHYLAKP